MKKTILKPANKKKLELKKTAIANLQMSEEHMKVLMGGVSTDNSSIIANNCTIRTHSTLVTQTTL